MRAFIQPFISSVVYSVINPSFIHLIIYSIIRSFVHFRYYTEQYDIKATYLQTRRWQLYATHAYSVHFHEVYDPK